MKKVRWFLKVLVVSMAISGLVSVTAFAKKITSLTLTINPDIKIGESVGTENIIINNGKENSEYDVSVMTINHKESVWGLDDEPEFLISVAAKDKFQFNKKLKKEDVSVTNFLTGSAAGNGVTVEEVKVNNGGYDVSVKVKLAKLALTHTGQVDSVSISPEGVVSWDEALGSTSYELRVMKDDQPFKTVIADATNTTTHQETREVFGDASKGPTGTAKDAEIKAKAKTKKKENVLEYNLMSLVTVPGMYYVEVVPLNGLNSMIRGDKVVSAGVWLVPGVSG
ncbi:hypothetical protein [Oribacterium sp. NK2B42]|uniref:hypothetical protein n=1 Tax=Oribacterium sp. NK2B42 TaxID=689781 RepID=UPI0004929E8A|nr:hypothetical protein [Oribacterium sp. NK2B42]